MIRMRKARPEFNDERSYDFPLAPATVLVDDTNKKIITLVGSCVGYWSWEIEDFPESHHLN